MINTPENCRSRAATARAASQGPMLENVRRKHLLSAAAWESLARVLAAKNADATILPLPKNSTTRSTRSARSAPKSALPASIDNWENEGGNLRA